MVEKKDVYTFLKAGTDAEVFLTQNGKPFPVCGLVGGTKENPKPVPSLGDGFAVQEDNVMLEFNIPPAKDAQTFSDSIAKMLTHITAEMKQRELQIEYQSAMYFTPDQLQSEQARRFGCEPDYCVWTRSVNSIVRDSPTLESLRTAAAHLHVSYKFNNNPPEIHDQEMVVKVFDSFIGGPGMLRWSDTTRRALYGKCGAFRPKSYGIEYRVLGNEWIKTEVDRKWVFNRAQIALCFLNDCTEYTLRRLFQGRKGIVARAIDQGLLDYGQALENDVLQYIESNISKKNPTIYAEFMELNPGAFAAKKAAEDEYHKAYKAVVEALKAGNKAKVTTL